MSARWGSLPMCSELDHVAGSIIWVHATDIVIDKLGQLQKTARDTTTQLATLSNYAELVYTVFSKDQSRPSSDWSAAAEICRKLSTSVPHVHHPRVSWGTGEGPTERVPVEILTFAQGAVCIHQGVIPLEPLIALSLAFGKTLWRDFLELGLLDFGK